MVLTLLPAAAFAEDGDLSGLDPEGTAPVEDLIPEEPQENEPEEPQIPEEPTVSEEPEPEEPAEPAPQEPETPVTEEPEEPVPEEPAGEIPEGELPEDVLPDGELLQGGFLADGYGAGIMAEGDLSTYVHWSLSTEGCLTITGYGYMSDFHANGSVTSAPWGVYAGSITALYMDYGLPNLSAYALYGCTQLSAVTLCSSMTSIGAHAFDGCTGLHGLSVPGSVTSIGSCAFANCSWLSIISFEGALPIFATDSCQNDRLIFSYPCTYSGWEYLTEATVGAYYLQLAPRHNIYNGVCSLCGRVDPDCPNGTVGTNIQWVLTDAGTLVLIGSGAMVNFGLKEERPPWQDLKDNITDIEISEGITSIGKYAFSQLKELYSVSLPSTLTRIEDYAFLSAGMGSIDIPYGVSYIGNQSFSYCNNLTQIRFHGAKPSFGAYSNTFYCTPYAYFTGSGGPLYADFPCSWNSSGLSAYGGNVVWEPVHNYVNGVCAVCGHRQDEPEKLVRATGTNNNGNITWTLYWDYTLVFSGTGSVSGSYCSAKLQELMSGVRLEQVIIQNGITGIEDMNLGSNIGVSSLTVPQSVTSIASNAFSSRIVSINYEGSSTQWIALGSFSQKTYCAADGLIVIDGKVEGDFEWSLMNGVLTLSGTGAMPDYTGSDATPWAAAAPYITGAVVEEGLTSIGAYAFADMPKLKSVTLGSTVTAINSNAFRGCTSLGSSFTLPSTVRRVYDDAFADCTGILQLQLTKNLTYVGKYAFRNCVCLLLYPGTCDQWTNMMKSCGQGFVYGTVRCSDGDIIDGRKSTELNWSIENGVLTLTLQGAMASYTASSQPWKDRAGEVTSVVMSGSDSIGSYAFYQLENLRSFSASDPVIKSIGSHAFEGCGSLVSLSFPTGLKTIGDRAFADCASLASLTLPAGLTSVSSGAFNNCSDLTIYFGGTSDQWLALGSFPVTAICADGRSVTNGQRAADFHWNVSNGILSISGLDLIPDYSASNPAPWKEKASLITTVSLAEGQTRIGAYAFAGLTKLKTVNSVSAVTEIGDYAFQNCSALKELWLTTAISSVGKNAFSGCSGLTVIYPATIEDWQYMLALCGTKTVSGNIRCSNGSVLDGKAVYWSCEDDCLSLTLNSSMPDFSAGSQPWYSLRQEFSSLELNGTGRLGAYAFYNMDNLYLVSAGSAVITELGAYCFYDCDNLADLYFSSGLKTVGASAFASCDNLTDLTLPAGLSSVAADAFNGCGNLTITFGGTSSAWIQLGSFSVPAVCSDGKTVINGVTQLDLHWSVKNGELTISGSDSMPDYASFSATPWAGSSAYSKVTLASGQTRIGTWAFAGRTNIQQLSLPSTMKEIGNNAFRGDTGLRSLSLPSGLQAIGDYAFYGCTGLSAVTLPTSLTFVGRNAFANCGSLILSYSGTVSAWNKMMKACGQNYVIGTVQCRDGIVVDGVTTEYLSYTIENGVLTIDAKGAMENYSTGTQPWAGRENEILGAQLCNTGNIGAYAFAGLELMSHFSATDTIRSVGSHAFDGCISLESLSFASGLERIDAGAFSGCAGLRTLTLPAGVQSIDPTAFEGCSGLKISFGGTAEEWLALGSFAAEVSCADGLVVKNGKVTGSDTRPLVLSCSTTILRTGEDPVQLTVTDGGRNLSPDKLSWSIISGKSYAELNEKGQIRALTGGKTVTVQVRLDEDDSTRYATLSLRTVGSELREIRLHLQDSYGTVSVIERDVDDTSIDWWSRTIIVEEVLGVAGSQPISSIKATTSDKNIATVTKNKDGTFTIKLSKTNKGACTITFTPYVKSGKKEVAQKSETIEVYVRDYAPRMPSSITLNTYRKDLSGKLTLVPSYGNAPLDGPVTVWKTSSKGKLTATQATAISAEVQNGVLVVTPAAYLKENTKFYVEIPTARGVSYKLPLTVKVSNSLPKVTLKQQGTLALYETDTVEFSVSCSERIRFLTGTDNPTGVSYTGYQTTAAVLSDNGQGGFTLKRVNGIAAGKSGTASFLLEDYSGSSGTSVRKVGFTVKTASKPSLKLSKSTATVNLNEDAELEFYIYDNVKGRNMTAEELKSVSFGIVPCMILSDGKVRANVPAAVIPQKTGKFSISVTVEGAKWNAGTAPVKLSYKLTVQKSAPTLKLKKTTLLLNTRYPELTASTTRTVSQANMEVITEFTGPAGIEITCVGNTVTARLTDPSLKPGTYKFTGKSRTADGKGGKIANLTLYVNVVDGKPKASLSASGSLSLLNRAKQKTYKVSFTNVPVGFTVTGVTLNVKDSSGNDVSTLFRFSCDLVKTSGKYTVKIWLTDSADLRAKDYTATLRFTASDGSTVTSSKFTLTPTQPQLKVTASPSSLTVYQSQAKERTLKYTVKLSSPAGAEIESVSLGSLNSSFRSALANAGSAVSWNLSADGQYLTVYVQIADTSRLKKGSSYTLPLTIKPRGSVGSSANAKINLTVKVAG